jgi:hypothetical protein
MCIRVKLVNRAPCCWYHERHLTRQSRICTDVFPLRVHVSLTSQICAERSLVRVLKFPPAAPGGADETHSLFYLVLLKAVADLDSFRLKRHRFAPTVLARQNTREHAELQPSPKLTAVFGTDLIFTSREWHRPAGKSINWRLG